MKRHMNICIKVEETVGKIYRQMATSANLSLAVKQTLQEMANDEDDHASQLQLAVRLPENMAVTSSAAMLQQAEQLLAQAEHILRKVSQTEVTDQQAIKFGIKLEENFCQAHIACSFEFTDDRFRSMFAAMARADKEHCQRLFDLEKSTR